MSDQDAAIEIEETPQPEAGRSDDDTDKLQLTKDEIAWIKNQMHQTPPAESEADNPPNVTRIARLEVPTVETETEAETPPPADRSIKTGQTRRARSSRPKNARRRVIRIWR